MISLADTVEIKMGDFFFEPATATIKPGDTVRWINNGSMSHTTTSGSGCSPNGVWNSGVLAPGQSFEQVFNEQGTFPYFCDVGVHCEALNMQGAIVVGSGNALEDPIPEPIRERGFPIKLESMATGLTAPNLGTFAPGDPIHRLFVTDQVGILWAINLTEDNKAVFLDVAELLVELGIDGPGTFDERGLLGVAFHPDYATNGLLYTYTSEPVNGQADFSTMPPDTSANHQSVIREWKVPNPSDPASVVDPNSARVLLRIDEPQFNHNGGALNFGADKMLYIALGDGGEADDQGVGHGETGNGQDPSNVLGTILRIDVGGSNSANGQYGIPPNNPFVGQQGFVSEILAYGFRNPFRFSFDRATGELYAADVGQNDIEEVDIVVPGGNYGWNIKEGSFCFNPNGDLLGFVTDAPECGPPDLKDPIAEYDHDEGIAIIGGFVYRGHSIPDLAGRYVFGDYAGANNAGRLFFLSRRDQISELRLLGQVGLPQFVLGFGEDAEGELYVLGNATGVPSGETGVVLKLIP